MAAPVSVKEELHQLIEEMDFDSAVRLLAMISLANDPDDLSPEEEQEVLAARADYESGNTIKGEDLEAEAGFFA